MAADADRIYRAAVSSPGVWGPGAVVGDHRLEQLLGKGGMGEVHVGVHLRTGARHAIKSLPASSDPELLLRFQREGEALARLDGHPHVVRVHATGEALGRRYLVMGLATGGDLLARLGGRPLPEAEVVALGEALADGLAHLHRHGLLHRDLKPHKVLFDAPEQGGRPRLADLGLVLDEGARTLTRSGVLIGTPAYMAPEQAAGERGAQGPATDVYGLGALLFHALTGRPPFEGKTSLAILTKVMSDPPPLARTLVPGISPALEAVLQRAMGKSPADRWPSAEAFRAALRRPEPPRRPRRVVALAGAATLAAGLLGVALLVTSRPPPPPTPTAAPDAALEARARRLVEARLGAEALREVEAALERDRTPGRLLLRASLLLADAERMGDGPEAYAEALAAGAPPSPQLASQVAQALAVRATRVLGRAKTRPWDELVRAARDARATGRPPLADDVRRLASGAREAALRLFERLRERLPDDPALTTEVTRAALDLLDLSRELDPALVAPPLDLDEQAGELNLVKRFPLAARFLLAARRTSLTQGQLAPTAWLAKPNIDVDGVAFAEFVLRQELAAPGADARSKQNAYRTFSATMWRDARTWPVAWEAEEEALRRFADDAPGRYQLLLSRAETLGCLGRFAEALPLMEEAVRRARSEPAEALADTLYWQATLLQQAGRHADALRTLDEAERALRTFGPGRSAWWLLLRARLLQAQGRTREAFEALAVARGCENVGEAEASIRLVEAELRATGPGSRR